MLSVAVQVDEWYWQTAALNFLYKKVQAMKSFERCNYSQVCLFFLILAGTHIATMSSAPPSRNSLKFALFAVRVSCWSHFEHALSDSWRSVMVRDVIFNHRPLLCATLNHINWEWNITCLVAGQSPAREKIIWNSINDKSGVVYQLRQNAARNTMHLKQNRRVDFSTMKI